MKLTVVIVSYNVRYYLEQCLHSLRRALKGIDASIYVVDNHSRDESVEYLTERFPEVNIIASNHNLGFSRANNIAIKQSESEYVLLLNPDTFVGENVLHDTLAFMDAHPKAGGLGVRMLHDNGESAMESRRGVPTPAAAFYKMSGLCARYPKSKRFGHYYLSYLPWNEPVQIEAISGAFFLARRKALMEVGMLDTDYFMYGEDIDLSYKLLKAGYENWYYPASILHYKGESTHKSSFQYVHVFYEAMLIFFRKHYSHLSLFVTIPIKCAIYAKATLALLKMQIEKANKSMGFFTPRHHDPLYVFIGKGASLDHCRQLARKKGLEAQFMEGDRLSLPKGHAQVELPANIPVTVVYDCDAYTYEEILGIFAANIKEHVRMGIWNDHTRTAITTNEVLR